MKRGREEGIDKERKTDGDTEKKEEDNRRWYKVNYITLFHNLELQIN